jgi:hypothetical protein
MGLRRPGLADGKVDLSIVEHEDERNLSGESDLADIYLSEPRSLARTRGNAIFMW